jgi:ankyrin repeat protein
MKPSFYILFFLTNSSFFLQGMMGPVNNVAAILKPHKTMHLRKEWLKKNSHSHKLPYGNTTLHSLIQQNHHGSARQLRSYLSSCKATEIAVLINQKNNYHDTPLHYAIKHGSRDILTTVLDNPHINIPLCDDQRETTALMLAIILKKSAATHQLLHHPQVVLNDALSSTLMNFNVTSKKAETDKHTRRIISSLLCFGFSSKVLPRKIRTIFTTLCPDYVNLKNRSSSKKIIRHPIVVDTMGDYKRTPLMYAAGQGNVTLVRWLLLRKANPLLFDIYKKSVLNNVSVLVAKNNFSREQKNSYDYIARLLSIRILGILGCFAKDKDVHIFSQLPCELMLNIICFLFGYEHMKAYLNKPLQRCLRGDL